MVLLLFAVVVPAVCLLWFMSAAMRNERLAVRQQLADIYRSQLSAAQARLEQRWRETAAQLEKWGATTPAAAAFAKCARSGIVDSVIIFEAQGRISYPSAPSAVTSDFGGLEAKWQQSSELEHLRKYEEAAKQYDGLARETTNENAAARAYQAEARCLVQAGKSDAAIVLVEEVFGNERYRAAADLQGRLIAANAELMVLELITNRDSASFQSTVNRLTARLADYENPVLAEPQRLFLMKEVQRLAPHKVEFPTLAAEELAAELIEKRVNLAGPFAWQPVGGSELWQFTTADHRVLALIRSEKLMAFAKGTITPDHALPDTEMTLVAPDAYAKDGFVTIMAGEYMPGWRLALAPKKQRSFDGAAESRAAAYLWTGILVIAVMGVLALLALRLMRRQMSLARLKNDFAATVSHELKTPISSMRVLLDTLLDSEELDEPNTREYLQLIAQENDRLGRLIQNFLSFSRMERNKHTFHFSPSAAGDIVEAAVESTRGRFAAANCRLEVQIEDPLPLVMADAEALAAALSNLLENACKYSDKVKHVLICARAENGCVLFSVKDHGIGIAPRERKKIFQPFYQADQHLSRKGGGCGLGLSIVRFITTAHRGSVSVESQPGCGSTFTISLPVAPKAKPIQEEAIA